MSNFDNFDIHQMSPKLAQRWHFACIFYCKKIFVLGSLDYAKNVKRYLFFGHPIYSTTRKLQWKKRKEIAIKKENHSEILMMIIIQTIAVCRVINYSFIIISC